MKNKIFTTESMCAIMKRNNITFLSLFVMRILVVYHMVSFNNIRVYWSNN